MTAREEAELALSTEGFFNREQAGIVRSLLSEPSRIVIEFSPSAVVELQSSIEAGVERALSAIEVWRASR